MEKTKMTLMYYFLYYGFSYPDGLLIFVSGFLYPEHKKFFQIYFSGMYYFLFWIFISGIKVIVGIF